MYCRNCKREISAEAFQLHEAHCCRNITLCEICAEPIPIRQREDHFNTVHGPITCPMCGASVRKDAMDEHKEKYCTDRILQCPYCAIGIKRGIFDAHVDSCGSRTDVCDRCGRRILLRDVQEHMRAACPQAFGEDSGDDSGDDGRGNSGCRDPSLSSSNRPHAKECDGSGVKIDPEWLESVKAAVQGGGCDPDALLAQSVFLEELGRDESIDMETDGVTFSESTDDSRRHVASPPTIQSDEDDRCHWEGPQLASDEAMARRLQEEEDSLYHATVDTRDDVHSREHWTAPPDTSSERLRAAPQHGRWYCYQERRHTLPTMTLPFASFYDSRTHPLLNSELSDWPFTGFHRNPFFTSTFRGSLVRPFSEDAASSSRGSTATRKPQKLHSSHGSFYYVEEPDD